MSDRAEDDLIALVSAEQRGFRRILFAGFGILFLLVAMSAALGVYYYAVSKQLTETSAALTETSARLERDAFDARIEADRQTNRVAILERAVRRTYDEFRAAAPGLPNRAEPAAVLAAVSNYLRRGRSLSEERLIEAAAQGRAGDGSAETRALLTGSSALLAWERSGEQISAGATGLPDLLERAQAEFETAQSDVAVAPLARAGVAWVQYLYASSNASNYAPADCEVVFRTIEASAVAADPGPQPLYWRAQCERKLGRTRDALRDYVLALRQSGELPRDSDEATLTLAMNAFHGVGTLLIATFDVPDQDLQGELDLAANLCGKADEGDKGSARMLLARSCLSQAVRLRERLHQTPNQVSGTRENVSFSYLRDGDFAGAYANASKVERTGLFAWNELVRALSAGRVKTNDAVDAVREARRNVRFFDVGRFNPCELNVLLGADLMAEARSIVEQEHKGEALACAATKAIESPAPSKS
jgi:hypothetical protein